MSQPTRSSPLIAHLSILGFLVLGFLVATQFIAPPVRAQASTPPEHRMELIYAFDGKMPRFSFSVDALRFDSVETLKTHLARLPRGSVVTWSPGCRRLGGEPLLSSQREMEEFRAFLEAHGIRLNLIPSG